MKEHIAVAEAQRLGIPVFGIVDTNSDPNTVDYIIPANDDAATSVEAILNVCCTAINEGVEERKAEKADENAAAQQEDQPRKRQRTNRPRAEVAAAAEEAPAVAEETAAPPLRPPQKKLPPKLPSNH